MKKIFSVPLLFWRRRSLVCLKGFTKGSFTPTWIKISQNSIWRKIQYFSVTQCFLVLPTTSEKEIWSNLCKAPLKGVVVKVVGLEAWHTLLALGTKKTLSRLFILKTTKQTIIYTKFYLGDWHLSRKSHGKNRNTKSYFFPRRHNPKQFSQRKLLKQTHSSKRYHISFHGIINNNNKKK